MGASTSFLKSFSGQLIAVQGRLDDLKEPVGELISNLMGGNSQGLSGSAGALASLQEVIVDATSDVQTMADKSKELGGGITGVGLACLSQHPIISLFLSTLAGAKTISMLSELITSIGTVSTAIGTIGEVSLMAVGGVVALSTAVGGLITYLTIAIGKMSEYYQASAETRAKLDADQMASVGAFNSSPEMYQGGKSIFDNNANGTNYFDGGSTLVGEYGPELVNLPRGSSIKTNAQTQRELSGGGSTFNIPVTIQGNVIGNSEFIDQIGDAISNRVGLALNNM